MTQHKLVMAVAKGGGGSESNMIGVFVIVGIHHLVRLEITNNCSNLFQPVFLYCKQEKLQHRDLVGTRL